ncbi:MAG: DnaJ domain-containing protein [Chloroflexota bacterium]
MVWIIYIVIVLALSVLIGLHLGRFRLAYTEMTGMMLGMTMGMLNGFLLGYAAAVLAESMFWGNLVGIVLGLGPGIYYGRAGGLMGVMDGGMGGVMGGSMGAMLAVMLTFPQWAQGWTAVLIGAIYILGMMGLVALIEQSAPEHAALHRLLPMFTRAVAREAAEHGSTDRASQKQRPADYYTLLGVPLDASEEEISEAYFDTIDSFAGSDHEAARIERALAVLSDPAKRQSYDSRLAQYEHLEERPLPAASGNRPSNRAVIAPISRQEPPTAPVRGIKGRPPQPPTSNNKGRSNGQPVERRSSKQGRTAPPQQARYERQSQERQGRRPNRQKSEPPVTWVGGIMSILLVLALGWWILSSASNHTGVFANSGSGSVGAAGETQAQLEQQAVVAQLGTDGKQNIDVVLNSATFKYEPKVIKVQQGTPVHFNLSVINGDPG